MTASTTTTREREKARWRENTNNSFALSSFWVLCKRDSMMRYFKYKMAFFLLFLCTILCLFDKRNSKRMDIQLCIDVSSRNVWLYRIEMLSSKANRPWFIAFMRIKVSPLLESLFIDVKLSWFPLDSPTGKFAYIQCTYIMKKRFSFNFPL